MTISFDTEWPPYAPTEILPGLFQGGTEDHEVLGCPTPRGHYSRESEFDLVITLYADAMPAPWGVEELRFGFPDSQLERKSAEIAVRLARTAFTRWTSGDTVLIRCQAGVNRSGLVTALVLMQHGMSADAAIEHLRGTRGPLTLHNRHFVRWLQHDASNYLDASPRSSQAA